LFLKERFNMGPINETSGTTLEAATAKIMQNDKALKMLESILNPEGISDITKSGRAVVNPVTSAARVANWAEYGDEVGGKMLKTLAKKSMELTNENAILKAVAALATPVALKPPAAPAVTPSLPSATPGIMSKLNPILNALSLATYSGDLNENEAADLATQRAKAPK
jgi:hypothetical protein